MPMVSPAVALSADIKGVPEISGQEVAHAVQLSAKAWAELAITHANWHRKRNVQRLNAIGTKRTFEQHDKVAVFVPPTAAEARAR